MSKLKAQIRCKRGKFAKVMIGLFTSEVAHGITEGVFVGNSGTLQCSDHICHEIKILKIYSGKNRHDGYEYILWKMEGGERVLLVCVF